LIETKKFETKKKFGSNKLVRLWYKHCEENNLPYIIITEGNSYAEVVWDNLTLKDNGYFKIKENDQKIRYEILSVCEKYRHRKLNFQISSFFGCFRNVRIEDASAIATIVFDSIVSSAHQ
jgi:hypothetical protein